LDWETKEQLREVLPEWQIINAAKASL